MQSDGRAQQKRQNKRLIPTDKGNNGETKNTYRYNTKQNRDRPNRKDKIMERCCFVWV
jgi:hypothetical protein